MCMKDRGIRHRAKGTGIQPKDGIERGVMIGRILHVRLFHERNGDFT